MAVNDVYRLSVDYTYSTQLTSPISGKTCFLPFVALASTGGTATGTQANPFIVKAGSYTPLGYQQIANATLATSQSLTVPTGATVALIQNNGSQPARWRDDGTDPTSSTGQRIAAGETLTYDGNLAEIELIREADGVTLDISYYS